MDIKKAEKLLRDRLAVLNAKAEKIEDELEHPVEDDFEEMAVEAQGDEVLEGLGLAANEEIREIQLALKRITEGKYAECGSCGNDIPEKRLAAIPYATLCVKCEEQSELAK